MQWIEILATLAGLFCVYFSIKQNILTWVFGFIQVTLYTFVFYKAGLYSDLGLHVFYMFIQFYGFYAWNKDAGTDLALKPSSIGVWLYFWIPIAVLGSLGLGYLMSLYTGASMPFLDAFTTTASIIAQFMMIKKKIENWIFWIVVNAYAIIIYAVKGLIFSSGLYFVFLIMAILGLIQWNKAYLANRKQL
jgi:nicotinamide mononucleotide transporter